MSCNKVMSHQQWAQNCNDPKSCKYIRVSVSAFAVAPKQEIPQNYQLKYRGHIFYLLGVFALFKTTN